MWKYLGAIGPCRSNDRLAVLNLLLFSVAVADGYCCPRRPRDFVQQVMEESLVTPDHLDLWMKDLSPDDSRVSRASEHVLRTGMREGRNDRVNGRERPTLTLMLVRCSHRFVLPIALHSVGDLIKYKYVKFERYTVY